MGGLDANRAGTPPGRSNRAAASRLIAGLISRRPSCRLEKKLYLLGGEMDRLSRRDVLSASLGASVAATGVCTLPRAAVAQGAYPARPLRLLVGFTPGTATDITARVFAGGAADLLGQQLIVEDR